MSLCVFMSVLLWIIYSWCVCYDLYVELDKGVPLCTHGWISLFNSQTALCIKVWLSCNSQEALQWEQKVWNFEVFGEREESRMCQWLSSLTSYCVYDNETVLLWYGILVMTINIGLRIYDISPLCYHKNYHITQFKLIFQKVNKNDLS